MSPWLVFPTFTMPVRNSCPQDTFIRCFALQTISLSPTPVSAAPFSHTCTYSPRPPAKLPDIGLVKVGFDCILVILFASLFPLGFFILFLFFIFKKKKVSNKMDFVHLPLLCAFLSFSSAYVNERATYEPQARPSCWSAYQVCIVSLFCK